MIGKGPCPSGKRAYRSKAEAIRGAIRNIVTRAKRRRPDVGHGRISKSLRAYRCLDCGQWHLTRNPPETDGTRKQRKRYHERTR
jgi:hypothetical protein